MTSKYSIRRSKPLPPSQARAEARARIVLAISQSHLSLTKQLKMPSMAVARMERHTDIYIATLRRHIEAMGGQSQVVVRFPEGAIKLHNFIDLDNESLPIEEPSMPVLEPLMGSEKAPVAMLQP
ncbi:transcriptional regulator [Pseudomonas turukhanskensis]|uniref:Transcriptional regulator n=1 Tax=Pseudomonas turukhanskensis TaxID=1806536 RepID=A0A9W6K5N2_9PSED|nr:transcriptional regulator [Pseudomonas turukhanskensis]GLK88454.1 hypothetical protein GCM10017655_15160 [Pseudomonas turukhanskensis]